MFDYQSCEYANQKFALSISEFMIYLTSQQRKFDINVYRQLRNYDKLLLYSGVPGGGGCRGV